MRLSFLLLILPVHASAQSVIEGHVELVKTKAAPLMVKRYDIVSKGGVLSTNPPVAIIYLEGDFAKPEKPETKQIIQKDFLFHPALLPVRTGTKVEFPNQDDAYHNVFSFSPAKRFDLGRYRSDEKPVPFQLFDKPGMITLRCDIHEHMRGIILVVDTPFYTISSPDGNYKLNGVPAGNYKLKAWLDSRTILEKAVEIKAHGTVKMSFP